MKTCSKCGEDKEEENFSKNPMGKNGLHSHCKVCRAATDREWTVANPMRKAAAGRKRRAEKPEEVAAYDKKWKAENPKKVASTQRRYYVANHQKKEEWRRLREYGLTPEAYHALIRKADGKCGVCFIPFQRTPHVDHDHATGKVRGLLCQRCNHAIGLLGDSPKRLRDAAAYLEATA